MHTGPTGGGAIGGAVSGAAGAMFFSSSDEIKQTVKNMDKRAMKKAVNPGFLFVKASFAQEEIKKTNLFKVPQYKDNPCAPAKKKKKPPTNSI